MSSAQRKHAPGISGQTCQLLDILKPVVEEDMEDPQKTRISYNLQKDYHVQSMLSKFIVEEERHG